MVTCQWYRLPLLDEPGDTGETCNNPATLRGCDGDVCAEHRCRCARPLPGVEQPPAEVTQWRERVAWNGLGTVTP